METKIEKSDIKDIVITGEAIYCNIYKPRVFAKEGQPPNPNEEPKYSMVVLIKKTDEEQIQLIQNTITHTLTKIRKPNLANFIQSEIKRKLRDGDMYKTYDTTDMKPSKIESMKRLFGHYLISGHTKFKPFLGIKNRGKLIDVSMKENFIENKDTVKVTFSPRYSESAGKFFFYLMSVLLKKKTAIPYGRIAEQKRIEILESQIDDIDDIDINKLNNGMMDELKEEKYKDEVPF